MATLRPPSPRAAPGRGLFLLIGSAVVAIAAVFTVMIMDARADARPVGAATDAVYAGCRTKATLLGAVLAVLCPGILALLFVPRKELGQRAAAERALDVLAATDPLTGLVNHRRFLREDRSAPCAGGP